MMLTLQSGLSRGNLIYPCVWFSTWPLELLSCNENGFHDNAYDYTFQRSIDKIKKLKLDEELSHQSFLLLFEKFKQTFKRSIREKQLLLF